MSSQTSEPLEHSKVFGVFQQPVKGDWNKNSLEDGSRYVREGDVYSRALALQRLFSKRQSMSDAELKEFRELLEAQVAATAEDPYFVATAIHTLAQLLDYLQSRGLVSKADSAADGNLLLSYLQNDTLNLQIRGAAIRAVGDLGIKEGRGPIERMLSDDSNANTPQIARNGCLALVKLGGENSLPLIRGVFESTADPSVFGTAAFCL